MAYSVSRRTREIGVRVALGATYHDVVSMIVKQGLRTVFIGVAIGLVGSLALTRTMQSLLFGVTATDPADLRRRHRAADGVSTAGLLHPCKESNEGGSGGSAEK